MQARIRLKNAGAALAIGLLTAGATGLCSPAWAHGHGHEHEHGGKEVYWDGPCKVERKFKHGEVREKRKCKAPPPVYVEQPVMVAPAPVVVQPGIVIQGQGTIRIP
jgi:hypothetical protein